MYRAFLQFRRLRNRFSARQFRELLGAQTHALGENLGWDRRGLGKLPWTASGYRCFAILKLCVGDFGEARYRRRVGHQILTKPSLPRYLVVREIPARPPQDCSPMASPMAMQRPLQGQSRSFLIRTCLRYAGVMSRQCGLANSRRIHCRRYLRAVGQWMSGRVARLGRRLGNLRATIPWISRHSKKPSVRLSIECRAVEMLVDSALSSLRGVNALLQQLGYLLPY
jgi:hypothetical protein